MQIFSLKHYEQMILQGKCYHDNDQRSAILLLEDIQKKLIKRQKNIISSKKLGLCGHLYSFFIKEKKKSTIKKPVRGLYMWGGVGRGKTWIMNLFFQSIPTQRKIRLHFHHFMLYVHQELSYLQGQVNPLLIIADRFKDKTDIFCFDEFFISDITDAILLGTLIDAFFTRGISLVATSNVPPDELYYNGFQRERFIPAIEQIKLHCDVIKFQAGINYRSNMFTSLYFWKYPLNKVTYDEMERIFYEILGNKKYNKLSVLKINHRQILTRGFNKDVLSIDFMILCGEGRSQCDYIELSRIFCCVLIYDVPVMYDTTGDKARRFISLIDEFYEHRVKLVIAAEASLFEIYQGTDLKFEYQRCLSRLQEMQSKKYWNLPHLP